VPFLELALPFDGDHPNALGHDLAAREIVKFVQATRAQEIGSS